jgi:hypothetical protein
MLTVPLRRFSGTVTILCIALLTLSLLPGIAGAAPGGDDEGGTPSLREMIDIALRDYNDAKGRLDVSVQRQAALDAEIKKSELRLQLLQSQVGSLAAAAYRGARMGLTAAILDSGSPDGMLHAATTVQYLTLRDDRQLRTLVAAQKAHADQKKALADEISQQQAQVAIMEKKKKEAENALRRAGGGQLSAGFVPGKATASQAPRAADGSWPKESCSADDPTTSSCLTPRTLHAYNEARLAGYTRYTACFRSGGSGEHPKGRACDYSANTNGFVDARATGTDKTYGDRLAGWLIANTDRLGILYVIWYKQIWFPGQGWRSYSGDGTPAGDHYNHVHLSIQ